MRRTLPIVVFLSLALAQTCQVQMTPPDYKELPVYMPQISLQVSPSALTQGGSFTVSASTTYPSATAWVRVRWGGGQLALQDVSWGTPGYSPLIQGPNGSQWVQNCPSVSTSTRELDDRDNGKHTFYAEALVYWREQYANFYCKTQQWDPSQNAWVPYEYYAYYQVYPSYTAPSYCTEQPNTRYWQVQSQVVSTSQTAYAYISWEQRAGTSYDTALQEFANRIMEDHKRATASMVAYAYAKEINDPVKSALAKVAQGYFYDCNWLGICNRADPAGEIKILTDVPSILSGLLATGRLCGGFITFCFGAQNSRGADIGPKVEIKTFLMVKGWRHDYLLLDRLIPRKYYDPSDREYPGVPEEERNQVLQSCRLYKDTQEGRRCLALVETPTGIVPTLKSLLMIDPMFQRGRQYP
uniref:Transglutaminase-like domain-containing protein n=1 Tax=Thermus caliditerrae TaxID=1330700 RepID=A0A7C5VER7_9DEIN